MVVISCHCQSVDTGIFFLPVFCVIYFPKQRNLCIVSVSVC